MIYWSFFVSNVDLRQVDYIVKRIITTITFYEISKIAIMVKQKVVYQQRSVDQVVSKPKATDGGMMICDLRKPR